MTTSKESLYFELETERIKIRNITCDVQTLLKVTNANVCTKQQKEMSR